jgi:hypothetical protein
MSSWVPDRSHVRDQLQTSSWKATAEPSTLSSRYHSIKGAQLLSTRCEAKKRSSINDSRRGSDTAQGVLFSYSVLFPSRLVPPLVPAWTGGLSVLSPSWFLLSLACPVLLDGVSEVRHEISDYRQLLNWAAKRRVVHLRPVDTPSEQVLCRHANLHG